MKYFLYVLYSKKLDRYYIGSTNNPDRRLNEHNNRHTKSTRTRIPWEMFYINEYNSRCEATVVERKLKKMKSLKYLEWFMSTN